jgi:hypothetical protein
MLWNGNGYTKTKVTRISREPSPLQIVIETTGEYGVFQLFW